MDEPGPRTTLLGKEIADQPTAWRRAIALGIDAPDALAAPGRLALIGCGSSWHAAKAIDALRETRGIGEADAFAASEAPLARDYDRIVAISRSGTTTEVRQALAQLAGRVPVTALVGDLARRHHHGGAPGARAPRRPRPGDGDHRRPRQPDRRRRRRGHRPLLRRR